MSINYQLCNLLLSLELNKPYSTNQQSLTPYLSICAAGDSSMSNLAHTPTLLACQHPTVVLSMKILCISLFFIVGWRFIALGCCHSMYATLRILRVSYALQGSAKQTLFPFCWLLTGFQTQRSLQQTLLLFA